MKGLIRMKSVIRHCGSRLGDHGQVLGFLVATIFSFSQADWVKTSGPDSIRAITSGSIVYGGDVVTSAILPARNGCGYRALFSPNEIWSGPGAGLTNTNCLSAAVVNFNMFVGTHGGGVFRSTNNGSSWTAVNSGLGSLVVRALAGTGTGAGGGLLAATDSGIFFSSTNGDTWTAQNNGLTNQLVQALAVTGSTYFAATPGGIFVSSNSGASWSSANTGLTTTSVRAIVVSGTNVFAGTDTGVFLSTNAGVSWTTVNTGLGSLNVNALAATGANIFAGTAGGVYASKDSGSSWVAVNTGMSGSPVHGLTIALNILYAGADDGIWRRPVSEMVTSIAPSLRDDIVRFRLTGHSAMVIDVSEASLVTLKAYTPSGVRAAVLLSERLPAGRHTRHLNVTNLQNGLYLYRLKIGESAESRTVFINR